MTNYTVQPGDTLYSIARDFFDDGSKFRLIKEANNMGNSNILSVGQVLLIPVVEEEPQVNMLEFHNPFLGGLQWKVTHAGVYLDRIGVEIVDEDVRKVQRIWDEYADIINHWAIEFRVPCELILATIATESGGNFLAIREEPGFISDEETPDRVSGGLMQLLISTAQYTMNRTDIDREWLFDPYNNIQAGTSYIARQQKMTDLDPPKVAAAYNHGRIVHDPNINNRWKIGQTAGHLDRFTRHLNAGVFVTKADNQRPAIDFADFYLRAV